MSLFENLHIRDSFLSGSFGAVAILRLMKKQKNLLFLMLPILVAACGGDSSSDNSNEQNGSDSQPNSSVAINALDSTTSVRKGTTGIVGLQNEVKTSDGSPAYLSTVTPIGEQIDAQCRNVNIDANNLTFTVRANEIGACTYLYQVSDIHNNVSTTAISRVAVQSSTGPTAITYTLPPIGQTVTESQTINIDLEAELGSSFPNGGVVESSVTVLGSGSASADPATNTISYTAANESNVARVLYTIIAGAEGEDVYLGTIDIAVSTTLNTAPTAQNFTYEDPQCLADNEANNKDERCDLISNGNNLVIDLADKIGDSDEGDIAQVIDVYAFDADVSLTNPNDPTSTEITFNTILPKTYYVSYVVSDHRGGYAIGQIEINVVGAFPYIIVDATSDVFAPPMTSTQADYLGLNVLGVKVEAEPTGPAGMAIPTFDWETANAICISKGGALPTRDQITALVEQEGFNLYTNNGWPSSFPFWTKDLAEDQVSAYAYDPLSSITSGQIELATIATTQGAYVSCIDKTPNSISIVNPGFLAADYYTQLKVNYQTASGVVLPYTKPLIWESSDTSIATVDENGLAFGIVPEQNVTFTATSYDGDLSDSATMMVTDNFLVVVGVSPDFEQYVATSPDECYFDLAHGTNSTDHGNSFISLGLGWLGKISDNSYGRAEEGVGFVTNCADDLNTSENSVRLKTEHSSKGSSYNAWLQNDQTFEIANNQDIIVKLSMKGNNANNDQGLSPVAQLVVRFICDGVNDIGVTLLQNDQVKFTTASTSSNVAYQPIQPAIEDIAELPQAVDWLTLEFPVDMSPSFRDDGLSAQCKFDFFAQNGMDVQLDNIMIIPAMHPAGVPLQNMQ